MTPERRQQIARIFLERGIPKSAICAELLSTNPQRRAAGECITRASVTHWFSGRINSARIAQAALKIARLSNKNSVSANHKQIVGISEAEGNRKVLKRVPSPRKQTEKSTSNLSKHSQVPSPD